MTKNIIKFIFLTITLFSLTINAYAKKPEIQEQEYIAVHFGQDSMQIITKMPDLQPTAADLKKENHSLYYTLTPQTIYGLETRMRTFSFNNGQLYQINFFFTDTSKEGADKLLEEMFAYHGKTEPGFNVDGESSTFKTYTWENKTVQTIYIYYCNKTANRSSLSISSTYKPLKSKN